MEALSVRDKIDAFDVELDAEILSPGDELTGRVRLSLKQSLTVQSVDLQVQGTCNVSLQHRQNVSNTYLTDDEIYVNEFVELANKVDSEMLTLSYGEHIFPFVSKLPDNLPNSFTSTSGRVAYVVKVSVRGDKNELGHLEPCIATKSFAVASKLSLADHLDMLKMRKEQARFPVKSKSITRKVGHVTVSLILPRRVYDANDMILLSADVENASRKTVKDMEISLIRELICFANGEKHTEHAAIVSSRDANVVRKYQTRQWRQIGLKLPANLAPSKLANCNLMSVDYFLVFSASLEGSSQRLLLQTPIVIGVDLPPELKGYDSQPNENPISSDIVYQGEVQDSAAAAAAAAAYADTETAASGRNGRPVVIVNYEGANAQPPSASERPSDSQMITMRFTDELQEPHSPYQNGAQVTRNPLFNENDPDRRVDQSRERLFQNVEAGLSSETEDILY